MQQRVIASGAQPGLFMSLCVTACVCRAHPPTSYPGLFMCWRVYSTGRPTAFGVRERRFGSGQIRSRARVREDARRGPTPGDFTLDLSETESIRCGVAVRGGGRPHPFPSPLGILVVVSSL